MRRWRPIRSYRQRSPDLQTYRKPPATIALSHMGLTEHGKNSASDHARRVREMFAKISPRYDLLNHVLSINIDRSWRRAVIRKLRPLLPRDAQVLDVACGTGDLSIALFEKTGARVVGLDFCRPMLE